MNYKQFEKILKDDWYIQGFPAVPIFLNVTACCSGFLMDEKLKLRYRDFLIRFEKGYAEYGYYTPDFSRIWQVIKPKIFSNPNYLNKLRQDYLKDFKKYEKIYKQIDQLDLKSTPNKKLLGLFNQAVWGQAYSSGIAHVIEPISVEIEKEFKNDLLSKIGPSSKFNTYYAQLTSPTKLSWVSKEELALKNIPVTKLKTHLKKYFWVQNSYRESQQITLSQLKTRWGEIKTEKTPIESSDKIKKQKQQLIKRFNLGQNFKKQIQIIDFVSLWQDERKANIYIAIHYLDKIIREISQRTNIDRQYLYYLKSKEALQLKSLSKLKSLKKELLKREAGCYIYTNSLNKEEVVTGANYRKLVTLKNKLEKEKTNIEDALHGSVANTGTAMGRVSICKNISQLNKVKEGDIMVSSMTRPEFMPAMKKAAAIITDEGGITCHAAIVSRELGKPCIIGTKVATKVLKDGMLVEVKANHGIVKIIK